MSFGKNKMLSMQVLVGVMLVVQAFVIVAVLYLRKTFYFDLAKATSSVLGWIMLIVAVVFSIWNIILLIQRYYKNKQTIEGDIKMQNYQTSIYGRYFVLIIIFLVGAIFVFLSGNLYYLLFVAFSIIWQVGMFPTKNKISTCINLQEEANENTSVDAHDEENGKT